MQLELTRKLIVVVVVVVEKVLGSESFGVRDVFRVFPYHSPLRTTGILGATPSFYEP